MICDYASCSANLCTSAHNLRLYIFLTKLNPTPHYFLIILAELVDHESVRRDQCKPHGLRNQPKPGEVDQRQDDHGHHVVTTQDVHDDQMVDANAIEADHREDQVDEDVDGGVAKQVGC